MDHPHDGTIGNAHGARRIEVTPETAAAPEDRISFLFDGVQIDAWAGEPIAVALLAAGVRVFRTMPKHGEAHGGYCLRGRCTDCALVVNGMPGVRGCVTPVEVDMVVTTQIGLGEWN